MKGNRDARNKFYNVFPLVKWILLNTIVCGCILLYWYLAVLRVQTCRFRGSLSIVLGECGSTRQEARTVR